MDARAPGFGNPAPWGYFTTFGWAFFALVLGAIAAYMTYLGWLQGNLERAIKTPFDGTLVTIGSIASTPVQIAILAFAIRIKRWPIADYLGLVPPRRKDALLAGVMLIVLVTVMESTLYLFGQELVPPFQIDAYRTAKASGWLPGLFLAIVLLAPIAEEVMFRGFVYRGFTRRPGHEPFAILVLTLSWMLLHVQYDWVGLLQVFIIGLFLGWVRWSSGSILLTIMLHVLLNFEAMTETVIRVEWIGV
jgi:uncharacterized protein